MHANLQVFCAKFADFYAKVFITVEKLLKNMNYSLAKDIYFADFYAIFENLFS